ncbi:Uma2 family endonuclease [Sphaerisporangium perillae]|uniref:Uma2 family endonuclease n=1 Tax=Sphaerisporangium perillae TaxID=2935860 RepID=UPI00200ECAD1|nr:Uma2 family endonuclease [Sphaerisporangium perillae]
MTDPQLPGWLVPPPGGFTAEDLDHIPDLPAHTELLDGSLVFVSPQKDFHSVITDVLVTALRRLTPADLRVRREMSVVLGPRQRPEPDVVVIRAEALAGPDVTAYQAADVVLVVEVVSPDSETRDRERKPQLYAAAGIRHFWRVEQNDGKATVYVYELDPATSAYALMGIHHDKLQLSLPFEVGIDLTEIERL